jgi:enediyne biosynthesis thioesterase
LAELAAFNEVVVRMRLGALLQNRISLTFEYWRLTGDGEQLVARGEQEIACMQREGDRLTPTHVPEALRTALRPFGGA